MTRKILLLWVCLFSVLSLLGQMGYDVQVAVDTTKMRIGEKIEYTLQVKADSTSLINFAEQPFFAPFEVLEESPIDTIKAKSHYYFTKKYALIQFDSGAYWLPRKVMVNGLSKYQTPFGSGGYGSSRYLKQKLLTSSRCRSEQNFDALTKSIIYGILLVLLLVGLIYAFSLPKKEERKKNYPFERALEELSFGNHYSIFTRGIQTLLLSAD